MLEALGGRTHAVVSGLCLLTPGWELVEHDTTSVSFRELTPRDLAAYVAPGEWEGRAGGYAIQGRGAALVERIEGDYLNVVGLPAALLVRTLAERFPGRLRPRLRVRARDEGVPAAIREQLPQRQEQPRGRRDAVARPRPSRGHRPLDRGGDVVGPPPSAGRTRPRRRRPSRRRPPR